MTIPSMDIIWRVLPRALDAENWPVIEACRRLIVANRLGWRRYTTATDWNIVCEFDQTSDELVDCDDCQ